MTSTPKFCSNCGETLNLNEEIKKCSKCGIDLQQQQQQQQIGSITQNRPIVDQLPYKSPGTAALIAFIGGIFALLGLGHIFVGKIGKGFGILVSGIIIYVLFVIMAISPRYVIVRPRRIIYWRCRQWWNNIYCYVYLRYCIFSIFGYGKYLMLKN